MDAKLIVAIIGVIFGISGWVTFFYNHITHIPKIKGRIFSPIMGQSQLPRNGQNTHITSFLFYLYLTNKRKTAVRALDYEMEVILSDGTIEKLERFYGSGIYNFKFSWVNNKQIDPNLKENLIYKKQQAIEPKEPLHGFVLFAGGPDLYTNKDITTYRLTIIDVFGEKHVIEENAKDNNVNLYLLSDLADFDIPN